MSPSSQRAWIEIYAYVAQYVNKKVALLAEGVDRNRFFDASVPLMVVALLAEGVDRNHVGHCSLITCVVALLAEGVDRNMVVNSW